MFDILAVTVPFFSVIAAGYGAGRFKVINADGLNGLNAFVYYFALPAMLFRVLAVRPIEDIMNWGFLGAWALAGLSLYALVLVLSRILFRVPVGTAALQALAVSFANTGYLGLPLTVSILGEAAAVPVALTLISDMSVSTLLTIGLIELGSASGKNLFAHGIKTARAILMNPFFLSIWGGILWAWFGLPIPGPVSTLLSLLGSAAGPCALFALGATLSSHMLAGRLSQSAFMVIGKLFVHPLVVFIVVIFVVETDPLWTLAALLNAALPIAGSVYVISQRYQLIVAESSTAILFSTLFGMFTVTVLMQVLFS